MAARIYFHLKHLFIPAREYLLPSQLTFSLGEELIWVIFLTLILESFFILSSFLNHVLPHGELWAANFFYCFKDVASLSSVVGGHPFLSSSLPPSLLFGREVNGPFIVGPLKVYAFFLLHMFFLVFGLWCLVGMFRGTFPSYLLLGESWKTSRVSCGLFLAIISASSTLSSSISLLSFWMYECPSARPFYFVFLGTNSLLCFPLSFSLLLLVWRLSNDLAQSERFYLQFLIHYSLWGVASHNIGHILCKDAVNSVTLVQFIEFYTLIII